LRLGQSHTWPRGACPCQEQRGRTIAREIGHGVATTIPPNNKAFSTDLFLYTRDVITVLTKTGLVGGKGQAYDYPGRDAVLQAAGAMATQILQNVPNDATSTVAITGPASLIAQRS
jgi:hypothetical protein